MPRDSAMRERPRHGIEDLRDFGINIDRDKSAKPAGQGYICGCDG
jgi:hypothetical protein